MKKKVLITGILGYIGTELVSILDSEKYDIIGIDNNYINSAVQNLVEKNIIFQQKDVFDSAELISWADYIVHTSGITKVPAVKSQETEEISSNIIANGEIATRFILDNMNDSARIIFLSTHCVFESLPPNSAKITEESPVCPNLSYSTTKANSEKDIVNSKKDYLILRLASVYGWSNNIRWSILPNLFSRKTAFNENLSVFGSGSQIKPLVSVFDLVKFINWSLNNDYKNEIVQFVNEHRTVKEIAEICASLNPEISINYTSDETPNDGYYVSNKKLLDTGFKFEKTIEGEIFDMISRWKSI